jgi:hypothetical protein
MDRECRRLLDFMEMVPAANRVSGFVIARKKWKELLGMEDLLKRCWHGNDRKP